MPITNAATVRVPVGTRVAPRSTPLVDHWLPLQLVIDTHMRCIKRYIAREIYRALCEPSKRTTEFIAEDRSTCDRGR